MKVLLSIKPEFVEKIFNGEKKFEYRKSIFRQPVEKVVIYSTKPVGKIVGEFEIKNILEDKPNEIWKKTNGYSGIHHSFFKDYFKSKNTGFAIEIGKVTQYDIPVDPKLNDSKFHPPQSFCYIN